MGASQQAERLGQYLSEKDKAVSLRQRDHRISVHIKISVSPSPQPSPPKKIKVKHSLVRKKIFSSIFDASQMRDFSWPETSRSPKTALGLDKLENPPIANCEFSTSRSETRNDQDDSEKAKKASICSQNASWPGGLIEVRLLVIESIFWRTWKPTKGKPVFKIKLTLAPEVRDSTQSDWHQHYWCLGWSQQNLPVPRFPWDNFPAAEQLMAESNWNNSEIMWLQSIHGLLAKRNLKGSVIFKL